MAMSWEITKVWIKVYSSINTSEETYRVGAVNQLVGVTRIKRNEREEGWDEAVALASQGWELVSSVPIISGHERMGHDGGAGSSHTEGYWLIFKREKEA